MIINNSENYAEIIYKLVSHLGFTELKRERSDKVDFSAVKDGKKYCFTCMYHIDAISGKNMEEFIDACGKLGSCVPVFVTNSSFSSSAKKLGDAAGVELWDRNYVDRLSVGIDATLEEVVSKKKSKLSPWTIVIIAVAVALGIACAMFLLSQTGTPAAPMS